LDLWNASIGHASGFTHLDIEEGFDLGVKFEKRDDARIPFWILYVSYYSTEPGPVTKGTLRFQARLADTEPEQLLRSARHAITSDLLILKAGRPANSNADQPEYV
jgi:hypothetical protein